MNEWLFIVIIIIWMNDSHSFKRFKVRPTLQHERRPSRSEMKETPSAAFAYTLQFRRRRPRLWPDEWRGGGRPQAVGDVLARSRARPPAHSAAAVRRRGKWRGEGGEDLKDRQRIPAATFQFVGESRAPALATLPFPQMCGFSGNVSSSGSTKAHRCHTRKTKQGLASRDSVTVSRFAWLSSRWNVTESPN